MYASSSLRSNLEDVLNAAISELNRRLPPKLSCSKLGLSIKSKPIIKHHCQLHFFSIIDHVDLKNDEKFKPYVAIAIGLSIKLRHKVVPNNFLLMLI